MVYNTTYCVRRGNRLVMIEVIISVGVMLFILLFTLLFYIIYLDE